MTSDEIFAGLREEFADPAHLERMRAFEQSCKAELEHHEEWRREHPDKWIAVFGGELVASDSSEDVLLGKLEKLGLPIGEVLIDFLPREDIPWIL